MTKHITLTEQMFYDLVTEMVTESLNELTDIYGRLEKERERIKHNAKKETDSPKDVWEIVSSSFAKDDHSYPEVYYTIRNKRTGERKVLSTFFSMSDPFSNWTMNGKYIKPKGIIVNGKPGPNNPCFDDADYLNNGGVSKHKKETTRKF